MSWEVKFNVETRVVEARFCGEATGNEVRELTSQCISIGKANNVCRFLIDAYEVKFLATIPDLYSIPSRQFPSEGLSRSSRIALIQPASEKDKFAARFLENASQKRNWNLQIFPDRNEAMTWLNM